MNVRLAIYGAVFTVLILSWVASFVIYQAAEMGDLIAPLEPVEFEELTIVAVGTGNEFENPTRMGPSLAVGLGEVVYLVDAGRGVAEALRSATIPVEQIGTVLLTSLQTDATLGLDDLWLTGWRDGRSEPLRVIGPVGTADLVAGLSGAHEAAVELSRDALGLPAGGAAIEVTEVEDVFSETRGPLRASAVAIGGGPIPALAWRFEKLEDFPRTIVVTGTGWSPDELVNAAMDADVWVQEAIYVPSPEDAEAAGVTLDAEQLERDAALHTSLLDVGELATRANVGHLVFWRLRPPPMYAFQISGFVSRSFEGTISVPEDGDFINP
jgi:ribonuclease BN (tRNA processing enzyme)